MEKYVLGIMSVCYAVLFTQHAKRMHRIILSSVACMAVSHFLFIYRRQDFRGKDMEL